MKTRTSAAGMFAVALLTALIASLSATAQTQYQFITLAGQPGVSGNTDGVGTNATFNTPTGLAVDKDGNVYVADQINQNVRKISPTGTVTTIATGFAAPESIDVDSAGTLYVADTDNHIIWKIPTNSAPVVFAGSLGNFGSSDGVGTDARFYYPRGVCVSKDGSIVYVADNDNHTIRKITADGNVTTFAGHVGQTDIFAGPANMDIDTNGLLYVADGDLDVVKTVTSDGTVNTLAGTFAYPNGVAVDSHGLVFVAATGLHSIKMIDGTNVTTIGGQDGVAGSADGLGNAATFNDPWDVALDTSRNLYIADTANHTIRKGLAPSLIFPSSQILSAGETLSLSISTPDTNASYQWLRNGINIADATNDSFIVTNVLRANAGTYTISINGESATNNNPAFVTVIDPVITNQPVSGNAPIGSKFIIAVGAAGTPIPGYATGLHYQWYFSRFGGTGPRPMPGRTNAFLKFNPVDVSNSGSYFCVITNRFLPGEIVVPNGNVITSAVATLTTFGAPVIKTQPTNLVRTIGNNAPFVVLAYGGAPFDNQWNFNGVAIPGATNSSYTRYDVQMADAGTYTCTVTKTIGTVSAVSQTSINKGHLTVNPDSKTPASFITYPATAITLTNGAVRTNGTLIAIAPDAILAGRAIDDGLITNITLIRTFPPWATNFQWDVTPEGQLPNRQTWATNVTLVDGTNTFIATATDDTGKTGSSIARTIFLRDRTSLAVAVNGSGRTVPVGPTTFGTAKNGALLDVNRGYFIKAVPSNSVHFVSWTDGLGTVLGNAATLQFIMTNGLILNANFDH